MAGRYQPFGIKTEVMFQKIKNLHFSFSGIRYPLGNDRARDWRLMLFGFLVCTVLASLFSLTIYTNDFLAQGSPSQGDVATSTPEILSQETITRIVQYYEGRQNAMRVSDFPIPADPSR